MSPFATNLVWIAVAAIVVAALAYWLFGRRRRPAAPAPAELTYAQGSSADPALAAFAGARDEPPTEDEIARARLGGVRGAAGLGEAPLPPQAREQIPRKIDDGHVA
jgi:hypothetical protein